MIYWVDQNPPVAIRRALPGNASSVETVSHCVCVCVWGGGEGSTNVGCGLFTGDTGFACLVSAHTCTYHMREGMHVNVYGFH